MKRALHRHFIHPELYYIFFGQVFAMRLYVQVSYMYNINISLRSLISVNLKTSAE